MTLVHSRTVYRKSSTKRENSTKKVRGQKGDGGAAEVLFPITCGELQPIARRAPRRRCDAQSCCTRPARDPARSAPSLRGLHSGDTLRLCEILALLGAGGMGEVYKARDTRLLRRVAITVLPDPLPTGQDLRARFDLYPRMD